MKLNGTSLPASGLSDAAVNQLEAFKKRIEENAAISRQDVLSIEEFIGTGIITQKIPINSFTEVATSIGLDSVSEILTVEIAANKNIEKDITYAELTQQLFKAKRATTWLLRELKDIEAIPSIVMDRFINEKYIFSYINENREETTEAIDTTTRYPIFMALAHNQQYIRGVLDTTDISECNKERALERLYSYLESNHNGSISDDLHVLPLLSALTTNTLGSIFYDSTVTIDIVNIRDMYAMYKNIGNTISNIQDILNSIEYELSSQMDIRYSIAGDSNKQLITIYKRLSNYNNVLEHAPSQTILSFFSSLASKN